MDQSAQPNYYAMLELSRRATPQEIKAAYRRLSRVHHPDRGGDTAKFRAITDAYEVLSDPGRRSRYDDGDLGALIGASAAGTIVRTEFRRSVRDELRHLTHAVEGERT
ncbi:J domain-containing protein [Candidatus Uhrbacteria bacterium]|nr:J domain-containing protein [Candidatus Uhrbacteria bacterium]